MCLEKTPGGWKRLGDLAEGRGHPAVAAAGPTAAGR